ncbi:MAG: amino acid permease, partial [Pseudomonadales bacterium]|nr:amino acid permease [Pseudomonadales bacterium]
MDQIRALLSYIDGTILWGPPMLIALALTGLYLMLGLKFMPLQKIPYASRQLLQGRSSNADGDISPFNALMTSLSATIGTGNIAGVATAIATGGPGALFWMWCIALVGMATKYAEAVCAVHYRETDADGRHVGGPMYYIKNGMGSNWRWLAVLFAIFGMFAGFGIGNTVQSNSVAEALNSVMGIEKIYTGITLAILAALVLIGGIRRIAEVVGKLVPLMAILYLLCGLITLAINVTEIPAAIVFIVK